ncbi:very short patch repair endonuclease [Bacillus sp. AFS017274]|uniref:very short patch repair endonuclease n=1 Tax=Bacillus sp. AFS017274 TaxID=2033488 RepID=UPI000BF5F658|nr:very short patch repair endonuclease [Bacillus sp. AFS017274]PEZ76375.1 very short patch repair endonuclease [Bacillus sp. AFS017274]
MTDVLTKEQRRKNMQAIKSQSKLENIVSKALWKKGYRFRKNTKDLFGKPDIAIKKYKIVIFIDSCFWHCCKQHGNIPKSNSEFWIKKLERNRERDQEVNSYYLKEGWHIKRIWEHEIKQDINKVINDIIDFIEDAKNSS